jgi:hypothetical protein
MTEYIITDKDGNEVATIAINGSIIIELDTDNYDIKNVEKS